MRIAATYSHLNGEEFLQVHHPTLLGEIRSIISSVDAERCRTKVSSEQRSHGRLLYSPVDINREFSALFNKEGWLDTRVSYWVTSDPKVIRKTLNLPPAEQKAAIVAAGLEPISSNNQTDFVKNRVAVEVQFGKYAFVAYDLFVKHLAFYVGDVIDVGVELLPMKEMTRQMSSGIGYYEGELYNLIREGRGVPGVPLVLIGITA